MTQSSDTSKKMKTGDDGVNARDFALEPNSFVERLASKMSVEIEEAVLQRLADRIRQGVSREEIIRNLRNIKGEPHPVDAATAALNFARAGSPGSALIVENILSFATESHRAFVLYAFQQILQRHPGDVELARLTHQLESGTKSRPQLMKILNDKAIEEGRPVAWDSAKDGWLQDESDDQVDIRGLLGSTNFRSVSQRSTETLTLCEFQQREWHLAPTMTMRADEVRSDSWLISDGFILTGPKSHMAAGQWVLEVDIVQPDSASLEIDIVANVAADQLLRLSVCGNVRGSFLFEKLPTHAFLEVRLQAKNSAPGRWISIQTVRLKRVDY